MKKYLLLASALLATSFVTSTTYANDSISLRICEYVQANDKQRLRKFLKNNKVKIRNIYSDIKCNGENILVFAAKAKALDVGDFIIGKLPAKKVAAEMDTLAGLSAHLADTAKKRVK